LIEGIDGLLWSLAQRQRAAKKKEADQREADRLFEEYTRKTDDELAAMRF
jgi:hypothetical protein